MKKQNQVLSKMSEKGSMMIEALAMLTLISLVTPTLYKKSAERTTELQDINAATHARTLMKAVDNYTSTNYEDLLNALKDGDSEQMTITLEQMEDYLPYGYNISEPIKNFGVPVITVQRQGDSDSLTSFVVFPKQGDITDLRASRIASMIGANGGYIDKSGKAKGVGGIWSLDSDEVSEICDGQSDCSAEGSIITSSNESINNASRASFENTKYLQRTPADDEDAKWRNTMMADLYMGGINNEFGQPVEYNSIYGVNRLILNGTNANTSQTDDLVINASSTDVNSGSAFVKGSLKALNNKFSVQFVTSGDNVTPQLNFAGFLNATDQELTAGSVTKGETPVPAFKLAPTGNGAEFNVNTAVDGTFTSTGDTRVAVGTNADDSAASFYVGDGGAIMEAHTNKLKMFDDTFALTNVDNENTSDLTVKTKTVELEGKTTIGNEADPANFTAQTAQKVTNPQLLVKNNAVVQGALEAGEIDAHQFDTLELHAGAENFNNATRWLNADKDGVIVKDTGNKERLKVDADMLVARDEENNVRLSISNKTDLDNDIILGSSLRGPVTTENNATYQGAVDVGADRTLVYGYKETQIFTNDTNGKGVVSIQNDAIKAKGKYDSSPSSSTDNTVSVNSLSTDVNTDQFVVRDHNNNNLLNIVSKEHGKVLEQNSLAEIDPEAFHIWAARDASTSDLNPNKHILEVNAKSALPTDREDGSNASVYIRRGAIEVEGSPATYAQNSADQGIGYIEASRFVDNSMDDDGEPLEPVFAKDGKHGQPTYYDRYMINPAYTSVMHDIKLTTRGGARLSDILPDFVNKGIYIVNNTYKEGVNFNALNLSVQVGGKITPIGAEELTSLNYGSDWASPFLGIVPAPLCPPGYASVITLTPSSFQIGQAGELLQSNGQYYVQESGNLDDYGSKAISSNQDNILTAEMKQGHTVTVDIQNPQAVTQNTIYYLGISNDENKTAEEILAAPKPLYFQPSTWLKNKVIAYTEDGPYSQHTNENFVGWAAIMGFIYPKTTYAKVIEALKDRQGVQASSNNDSFYWNIFPVRALSMEAYATVYCYFDRTNIFGSGNRSDYVDQYDQMYNFRPANSKGGSTSSHGNGSSYGTNSSYTDRLNDPHLKYNDPW